MRRVKKHTGSHRTLGASFAALASFCSFCCIISVKIAVALALVAFLGVCWLMFNRNAARELAAAKAEWNASNPALKFGEKPQDSPVVPDDKNILHSQPSHGRLQKEKGR